MGGRRRGLRRRPARCGPPSAATVWATCWPCRPTGACPPRPARSASIDCPATLPRRAWQKHSAGAGSHGHRVYSWAWIALLPEDDTDTGDHHLLIRRNDATGELAYLRCYSTAPGHPAHPGHRRGTALAHRGILPSRQRPHRARSAPGPALDLLAPLDHPGHARPCLPGRGHRHRTRRPTHPDWTDHVDRQRVSTPLRRPTPRHPPHRHQPAGLVTLATTTPTPSPSIPLPTTPTPMITIYGCSTNGASPQPDESCLRLPVSWGLRSVGDRDRRTGPVYEPHVAVSWPAGRPSDRSPS